MPFTIPAAVGEGPMTEWHKKSFVYQRIKPPKSIMPGVPVRSFEPYSETIGTICNTHMCTL